MAFNKRIALLKIEQGNGTSVETVSESKVVWADVSDIGTNTKITAETAGIELELQATIYKIQFDEHTHAEYNGVRYKIEKSGKIGNDLHVKLSLSRIK